MLAEVLGALKDRQGQSPLFLGPFDQSAWHSSYAELYFSTGLFSVMSIIQFRCGKSYLCPSFFLLDKSWGWPSGFGDDPVFAQCSRSQGNQLNFCPSVNAIGLAPPYGLQHQAKALLIISLLVSSKVWSLYWETSINIKFSIWLRQRDEWNFPAVY